MIYFGPIVWEMRSLLPDKPQRRKSSILVFGWLLFCPVSRQRSWRRKMPRDIRKVIKMQFVKPCLWPYSLPAAAGTALYAIQTVKTLETVLEAPAPAMEFAHEYLSIRAFSFLPALIALVGFSAFRGTYFKYTSI